jgi:lysophospholipase L1-like esterase
MIRLIYMLIGWLIGALLLSQYGGIFATPQNVSSNWRVISPMLEELSGEPQIGLGIHVADGALRITKHLLYPSDTLVVNHNQQVKNIDIKLSPQSGTLVMSLGNTSKHFIFIEPTLLHPNSPSDNGIALQNNEVHLKYMDGSLFLVQDGWKTPITTTKPQTIEFMTTSNSAAIEYISMQDDNDKIIFQEDYRQQGKLGHPIELGGFLGLFLGLVLSFGNKNPLISLLQSIVVLTPIWGLFQIPRDMWMYFCERLYLSQSTGWDLAQYSCGTLYILLLLFHIPSTKIFSLTSRRDPIEQTQIAQWVWIVLALCSVGYQYQEDPSLFILYILIFFLLPLRFASKAKIRSTKWYLMDIPTLVFPLIITPEIGILLGIFWRMVILLSNLSSFRKWNSTVLADTFFICLLLVPIQTELFLRSTYVDNVWSPEGLKVQYRSADNATSLPLTWKGICGNPPTTEEYTVVITGGSSTGGAYQFKDEPHAFFSTRIHKELCGTTQPSTKLSVYNYGSADLNTHLITKRFSNITQSKPDILILYIGVNDVLTQRYPKTARQRDGTSNTSSAIPFLFSSRLLTGLSIPLQPQSNTDNQVLVSEVPPKDALKNLAELRKTLPESTHLIVIPEIIVSHLRKELQKYDDMLKDFASQHPSNTHYFIPTSKTQQEQDLLLADRNHLSREGNQWLGDEISKKILDLNLLESRTMNTE